MNIETCVYENFEYYHNKESTHLWEWLLNELPDVHILKKDNFGFIEFSAPVQTIEMLERFLHSDEDIYHCTLNKIYGQGL